MENSSEAAEHFVFLDRSIRVEYSGLPAMVVEVVQVYVDGSCTSGSIEDSSSRLISTTDLQQQSSGMLSTGDHPYQDFIYQ